MYNERKKIFMKEQNVDKLFKDTFSNFEADVNPSVWTNIEQGLSVSPQNVPSKPSGFFGKITLNTVIFVAAISAILVGTTAYFSSQKPASKNVIAQNVQSQSQPGKIKVTLSDAPPINEVAPIPQPKNTAAEKQTTSKAEEKVMLNEPPKQTAPEKKTENTSAPKPDNTNSGSVKTPAQINSSSQPSTQNNPANTNEKISATGSQPQQQGQVFNPPAIEQVVSPGPENSLVPAEGVSPAELGTEDFHFFIPNVFTPNGDLVNDYFTPIGNTPVKDYEITIYDRYGFEIFKSKDVSVWWDGKLKDGTMAAEAVYVYIIKLVDFKDEPHDYMGVVALLK